MSNSSDHDVKILTGSSENSIHHNNFNSDLNKQAYDDGSNNTWDDGETGNYYSGYDVELYGPREIDGSAESVDNYPNENPF